MQIKNDTPYLISFIETNHLKALFDFKIMSQLQLHCFNQGEQIIDENTAVKYLYLVLEGEARIAPSSKEGKFGFLDYILPMDVIGDMEYFTKSLYFHSVVALTPCTYLAIPVSMIDDQLNQNIQFYRFICENMAAKMKRTSAHYSRALLYPLKNRLAQFLLDLSYRQQTSLITAPTEQTAEYLGVTSRHLRRVLSELEKDGIIHRFKDQIQLDNQKVLLSLVQLMKD